MKWYWSLWKMDKAVEYTKCGDVSGIRRHPIYGIDLGGLAFDSDKSCFFFMDKDNNEVLDCIKLKELDPPPVEELYSEDMTKRAWRFIRDDKFNSNVINCFYDEIVEIL